ncbi:uncharacterized protein BJ212DRAFT_1500033 [Suillus subaureus]|uniref:Uncharacterized protein n=1 Tax=Suillus subaureus TaxID=48587 RepID=A0A9P7EC72_9AGAM|nr:uncharacterized protein BJ212DRAFT_1500033 [Suillus subaureus]KAG1817540.1 hypothetical protein BJ212DRAFT_1500033 [Suillus subaureus]
MTATKLPSQLCCPPWMLPLATGSNVPSSITSLKINIPNNNANNTTNIINFHSPNNNTNTTTNSINFHSPNNNTNTTMNSITHTTCSAKIFTSQPGVSHTVDFYVLIHPHGGLVPPPIKLLLAPSSLPQAHMLLLPLPNPQPPLQDSQLPPLNQLDTGAQHSPPAYLPPSHHPPPHFTGTRGSPVDDLDGDLYDDPYADDNGPLSAPHYQLLDPFCCHQPSAHSPKHMCHY